MFDLVDVIKNKHTRIFNKEPHYFIAASLAVCGYVLLMKFSLKKDLINSGLMLCLVLKMKLIVPAISKLYVENKSDLKYWEIFFSLFWITSPIYWILGFLSAPWLSADRYKKFVLDTTIGRVLGIVIFGSLGIWFELAFPILNGMMILNQESKSLPILMLSWWYTTGIIYYQAQATRVFLIKINH